MPKVSLLGVLACCFGLLSSCGNAVSGSNNGGSGGGLGTYFSVSSSSATATAGTAINFRVTAVSGPNQVPTNYSGTVQFTSSDRQASLPGPSMLANGTGTFSAAFKTAGSQIITVTAANSALITGALGPISVSASTPMHLVVTAPSAVTAGSTVTITVNAVDAFSNVAPSYSGTVHFTSNDAQAVLPPNSALTNGTGTFSVTFKSIGNPVTITATDTSAALTAGNSSPISVVSNATTHFSVTGNPSAIGTGATFTFTVTALDAANNVASGYAGTVHFSSTDAQAKLPANSTLAAGSANFSGTLETVASQTVISATDTAMASITGSSSAINVTASPTLSITSGAPPSGAVGVNYGQTVSQDWMCHWKIPIRPNTWVVCDAPCNPSPGVCASYPPCGLTFIRGTCTEARQIFLGFTLTATGGVPPYTWSASGLPPGLSVNRSNGEITGTPTTVGPYPNVSVILTDSAVPAVSVNNSYAIPIGVPPHPVVNSAPPPPPGVVGQPYNSMGQEENRAHHHYKLIDLGTLGGIGSGQIDEPQVQNGFFAAPGTRMINSQGVVTGVAELPLFDPNAQYFCGFFWDCGLAHAVSWRNGKLTDLGALPGVNDSFPNWINNRGEIAGASYEGSDAATGLPLFKAVLWKDHSVIELGALPGGNQSYASALNERGDVVGAALNGTPDPFPNLWSILFFTNSNEVHAVRWRNGAVTDLGTLGGPDSMALFVNDSGQIAGQSLTNSTVNATTGQPTQDPFFWENGKMTDLGTFGGTLGIPTGMNNRGQVVGEMGLAGDVNYHPFLWERGKLTDLGTLGGAKASASWINEEGTVLGISFLPIGQSGIQTWHAYIWKKGEMIDLGTPDGDPCSDASVMNSREQAVGISSDCNGNEIRPYLWERGSMVDLRSLVLPGSDVTVWENLSINDRGEIAAAGRLPDCQVAGGPCTSHSVLLIPCDEDHPYIEGCDYDPVVPVLAEAESK